MRNLPSGDNSRGTRVTVADFLEAGRERLALELVAGRDHLERVVAEPIVNRPGLALTGFFRYFAWKRLQLVGQAEIAYFASLDAAARRSSFEGLLKHKAFFFVYTNGAKPTADEIALAERYGAVLLRTPLKTREFSNQGTFVLERLAAPTTTLYGTMVEVAGIGVFIEGAPGLGKSETALGLVKRGCALVADDLTCVRREVGTNILFGSASEATAGFMELRGIGIMHVPRLFGVTSVRGEKRLQLVITFRRLEDVQGEIDRVGQDRHYKTILGVDVPNVIIPVSEGRDLVNLVETAATQQRLLMTGFDPVEALSQRLRKRAEQNKI